MRGGKGRERRRGRRKIDHMIGRGEWGRMEDDGKEEYKKEEMRIGRGKEEEDWE